MCQQGKVNKGLETKLSLYNSIDLEHDFFQPYLRLMYILYIVFLACHHDQYTQTDVAVYKTYRK